MRDSTPHLGRRELARVHGHATVREAPHQSDAELGLARRRDRLAPRIGQQFRIDIRAVTVGIDIGAWEKRLDQRRADGGRRSVERFDMRVLGLPDDVARGEMIEVVRIRRPAVRRVEHQRDRLARGVVSPDRVAHDSAASLR